MQHLKFERISGEDLDAFYNLYVDGKLVESKLTMDEVIAKISNLYEQEGDKNA